MAAEPALSNPAPQRQIGIDIVRIAAALGTVWVHTVGRTDLAPYNAFGRFAVAFFTFVAGIFLVSSVVRRNDRTLGSYAQDRFVRLYLPFLFWSALFLGLRVFKRAYLTGQEPVVYEWSFFLTGTTHHLWFLPFLLISCVIAFPIVRWAVRSRERELVVGLVCLAAGLFMAVTQLPASFASLPEPAMTGPQYFASRSWVRAPGFLWGLAAGLLFRFRPEKEHISAVGAVVAGIIWIGCLLWTWQYRQVNEAGSAAFENIAGLAAAMVAFGPWPSTRGAKYIVSLGALSYGVYLLHPMFGQGMRIIRSRFNLEPDATQTLLAVVVSVVGAVAVTFLMRSNRWTRWTIP